MRSTFPPADPRYLHTVSWWQHTLDNLGCISSTVARLTPDSPVSLCGGTLVVHDSDSRPVDDFNLPPCPVCSGGQKTPR